MVHVTRDDMNLESPFDQQDGKARDHAARRGLVGIEEAIDEKDFHPPTCAFPPTIPAFSAARQAGRRPLSFRVKSGPTLPRRAMPSAARRRVAHPKAVMPSAVIPAGIFVAKVLLAKVGRQSNPAEQGYPSQSGQKTGTESCRYR